MHYAKDLDDFLRQLSFSPMRNSIGPFRILAGFDPDSPYPYFAQPLGGNSFAFTQKIKDRNIAIWEWVNQTFGEKRSDQWGTERWRASNSTYYFKYEKDRDWFLLKWG